MSETNTFDMSFETIGRNVGIPGKPDTGPAKNVFAFSGFKVTSSVPFEVIGEPLTVKIETGIDNPTEVTLESVNVTKPPLFVITRFEVVDINNGNTSFDDNNLKVGMAGAPDEGPAKNVFEISGFKITSNEPADVTGEPITVKIEGINKPTDVTVPPLEITEK